MPPFVARESLLNCDPHECSPLSFVPVLIAVSPFPKNTTKWVKNALRAKGGAGKDDRKAIAEQLKLGQELRAKVCRGATLADRAVAAHGCAERRF